MLCENFDVDDFMRDLQTVPHWVKNPNDLMTFLSHIQYRFLQAKAMLRWYEKNCKTSPEQEIEIMQIVKQYDGAYSKFKNQNSVDEDHMELGKIKS